MSEQTNTEQTYCETSELVLHVAHCAACDQTADDDGGEYQINPERAVDHVLRYHDWKRDEAGRLICDECQDDSSS